MGYAAAAPAYSPNMYPGANPTFQTGMQAVCAEGQKCFIQVVGGECKVGEFREGWL